MGADPGSVNVTIDRWTLAEELWSFGEDDLFRAPLAMSDDDLIRVWDLTSRIYMSGEGRSGGESAALATVAIIEGRRRPLARTRRRPQGQRPRFDVTQDDRYADVRAIEERAR